MVFQVAVVAAERRFVGGVAAEAEHGGDVVAYRLVQLDAVGEVVAIGFHGGGAAGDHQVGGGVFVTVGVVAATVVGDGAGGAITVGAVGDQRVGTGGGQGDDLVAFGDGVRPGR